jgi:hypothetical protein
VVEREGALTVVNDECLARNPASARWSSATIPHPGLLWAIESEVDTVPAIIQEMLKLREEGYF